MATVYFLGGERMQSSGFYFIFERKTPQENSFYSLSVKLPVHFGSFFLHVEL